jgi:uncharacterized protein (TIGR02145 family)
MLPQIDPGTSNMLNEKSSILIRLLTLAITLLFFSTCNKEQEAKVLTGSIDQITITDADAQGTITDCGDGISGFGHCWSVNAEPDLTNDHTELGKTTKVLSFTSHLHDLLPGTVYHVRAYVISNKIPTYGKDCTFTTLQPVLTSISTTDVISITQTSAVSGGNILSEGDGAITEKGVCWSTHSNPTTSDNSTSDGSGTGVFSSSVSNLSEGTTYYLRAYAVSTFGTAYGNEIIFETAANSLPSVTTADITDIGLSSAISGGTVTSESNALVNERGVCWSTSANPTIENQHSSCGTGIGTFVCTLSGLGQGSQFHVRSYATNNSGTAYGEDMIFNTKIADNDGNVYNTVTINGKMWMAENLRTTKYRDGSNIPNVTVDTVWKKLRPGDDNTSGAYCWYNNDIANKNAYGALYSGTAVHFEVCPVEWHVPGSYEVLEMILYLDPDRRLPWGAVSQIAGGKLKQSGFEFWTDPNSGATNETGFSALPGGMRGGDGSFVNLGLYGTWFMDNAYANFTMTYDFAGVFMSEGRNEIGRSVRCVKDN